MTKASSENKGLKKVLTRLTALDKKVDKGFKEAAEFRQQTEANFAAINNRVDEGFKETAEFRKKTEEHFAGLNREILGIGDFLYDKTEAYHRESLKFQHESYWFQQQSQAFQQQTQSSLQESRVLQQQTRDSQNAMLITVQDIREAFQRF
jgi:predicted  nucleic acid-binding Zn-ribbon protein